MSTIDTLVQQLQLVPHPEGGFYRETYRSPLTGHPEGFSGTRHYSTAIYYLLPAGTFSAFHRISSDELWHFYEGSSLHVYIIRQDGTLDLLQLGPCATAGEVYQAVVPAGCWFASRLAAATGYALAGCTVAPGFDFADFTLADRHTLIRQYPQHQAVIEALTR